MPAVPERPLSKGELFNQSLVSKYRKTNKSNHVQQRRSMRRKKKAWKAFNAAQSEAHYQESLGIKFRQMFGTEE